MKQFMGMKHKFVVYLQKVKNTNERSYVNLQCDQLPDGLIAQLAEHCTSIAEVMGSNPVQA